VWFFLVLSPPPFLGKGDRRRARWKPLEHGAKETAVKERRRSSMWSCYVYTKTSRVLVLGARGATLKIAVVEEMDLKNDTSFLK
jgi:hypothetical protein